MEIKSKEDVLTALESIATYLGDQNDEASRVSKILINDTFPHIKKILD